MQFYELEVNDVNEIMRIVNNIISKPQAITYLEGNFSNNTINYIIKRFNQCLAVTENNIWIYYNGPYFYYCGEKTIRQVIKKLSDNNTSQNSSHEIENKLNAIEQKLENIQTKHETTNYNGLLSNIFKPSNESLKNISKKIDSLNNMITFQFNRSNNNDVTKDLSDIIDKITDLNKQLGFIEDDLKAQKDLLRSIRNQGEDDIDSSKQITRSINNILGTVTLLKNDIENIKVSPEEVSKDTKEEEVEIINPDVALLKEMHQTATKLNDLILKTALMVAKKGEATDDVEDSRENLNDQSDENTESKDNQDKTNQETINDDIEDANNRIIIEELKD